MSVCTEIRCTGPALTQILSARRPKESVRCPECLYRRMRSTDSIPLEDGGLMRRRACRQCGQKWTTIERVEGPTEKTKF